MATTCMRTLDTATVSTDAVAYLRFAISCVIVSSRRVACSLRLVATNIGRRDRPASSHLYVSRRWYCSRCRRNLRLLSMRPDRADTPMSASTTPTLTNTSRKLCLSASAVFRGGHQNQTRLCGVWPRLPSARATCRRYMETLDQVPTTRSCCPVALQQTWPSRPRRLEATHQGSEPRRRRPRGIVATSTTGRIS